MSNKKVLIPIFLVLLIGIIACIGIFTGNKKNDTPKKEDTNAVQTAKVFTTIIVEINPKLALEIDEDKNVINMYPLNADAKKFNRDSYIGKSLDESIEQVMTDAKDYIKKNGKITISAVDESKEEKHIEEINKIKKEIVEIIEEKNDKIEVKQVELSKKDVEEIIKEVEEIKVDDKKNNDKTTTTQTTTTTTTSTSTTTSKQTTKKTTSKTTTKKKTTKTTTTAKATTTTTTSTTTQKPDYNLNDNIKLEIGDNPMGMIYIYPTKDECKGKYPNEIAIPDGQTYDSYCGNQIPNQPVIKGKGYYCETSGREQMEPGVTTNKPYSCTWIRDIVSSETILTKINNYIKTSNAVEMGGGAGGGGDEIILDEAACKKYSLSCGRW